LRVNLHTKNKDPRIELSALKTIAGFLNSNGGILTIGVADDRTPLGIHADDFENEDKMSLHLVNLIKDRIGPVMMQFVHPRFEDYDSCRIMVIECYKSKSPVFVKDSNLERFYVRTGPSTTELSASQTQEYIKQRYRV
jgi:predicted HTH transcriptional regulator